MASENCRAPSVDQSAELAEQQGGTSVQFEAWAGHNGYDVEKSTGAGLLYAGEYLSDRTDEALKVWQAALAARQPGVQVPEYIRDVHDVEQGLIRNPSYAPPAQGIDPVQLRALAEQWKHLEYPFSYEGQQAQRAADACRADLLALIDQRDAAPGPRISQGSHDPSGVGNG